jgi:hypothetical protein
MARASAREMISSYLREQADWRELKAEQYPEDQRNAQCAAGLRDLADHVDGLAEDDERIVVLSVAIPEGSDRFSPGEEASRLISRYRFSRPYEDPDSFLEHLADVVVEEGQ